MKYNRELFDLYRRIASDKGLSSEVIDELLKIDFSQSPSVFPKLNLSLSVKGLEHSLDFKTTNPGRIFELKGENSRYKTTALILIGMLLGCDWDAHSKFMNNFKLETQIENVRKYIYDPNVTIELLIQSDGVKVVFSKTGNVLDAIINNEVIYSLETLNNDFQDYQETVATLFRVQFISKGRDFVTQVHNEIVSEFTNSIQYIIQQGRNYLSKITSGHKKQVYPKTLTQYQNDAMLLSVLQNQLEQFRNAFPLVEDINFLEKQQDVSEIRESLQKLESKEQELVKEIERIQKEYQQLKFVFEQNGQSSTTNYPVEGWKDPVRGMEVLKEAISRVHGNDVVPIIVQFMPNQFFSVKTKEDIEHLIESLVMAQISATKYFESLPALRKIKEINLMINGLNSELITIQKQIYSYRKVLELVSQISMKNWTLEQISAQAMPIRSLLINLGITESNTATISTILVKRLKETHEIIRQLESPQLMKQYSDIEIIRDTLNSIERVNEFLAQKSSNESSGMDPVVRTVASQSLIYQEVIDLFNSIMKERCKYYYRASGGSVSSMPLKEYNFESRILTTQDGQRVSATHGLSGGIDSAMTVRSLASSTSDTKFGTVVLVDEWGDVSEALAKETYKTLLDLPELSMCVFVKVASETSARIYTIDGVY